MKIHLLIICLFLIEISCYGQEPILKFKPGKHYELYFVDASRKVISEGEPKPFNDGHVLWKDSSSFLINDELALTKLRRNWIGTQTNKVYYCWYDYFIYVVEDGKIVDELRVNEGCKQVQCPHAIFDYSNTIIDKLDKRQTISVAEVHFSSIPTGREFYKDIKQNSAVFVPAGENEEWLTFDGTIRISTNEDSSGKSERRVRQDLKKQFPNDAFALTVSSFGGGSTEYNVYCSKKMGDNIQGYTTAHAWQKLTPSEITVFSTAKSSIELELLKER